MPELPEIETIRRDLVQLIQGQVVSRFQVFDRRLLSEKEEIRFRNVLLGQAWQAIGRKGKYLTVDLADGHQLVFHMRMTGQLVVMQQARVQRIGILDKPLGAKPRMVFEFDGGIQLAFFDQRRFGEVHLINPGGAWPGKTILGPDPLNGLHQEVFVEIVRGRSTRVKPLLMDQRLLAGVGNIYAQEALFKAGIRPSRPGRKVTMDEAGRLYHALRETLEMAIEHRGSTSRNYRDARGEQGSAQTLHAVYLRGGKPCLKCGHVLRAARIGGRGTVFCSTCQR